MTLRRSLLRLSWMLLIGAGVLSGSAATAASAPPARLRLATWNLEWLLTPETTHELAQRCRSSRSGRRLPCDVVLGRPRSAADFGALARYARRLDADVVALQEVENQAAARRVFGRRYDYCFAHQSGSWQNVGFAVRRGLAFRCEADLEALSLGDRVRRGVQLTLFPGGEGELRILGVHLKSGCSRDPLHGARRDCTVLARQAPVLGDWIDAQVAAGTRFAVLGDFNRDFRRERPGEGLWARLADGSPRAEELADAGAGTAFVPCHAGQNFTGYIDYILLGGELASRKVPGSFRRLVYADGDAVRHRLSDHCPLAVELRLR